MKLKFTLISLLCSSIFSLFSSQITITEIYYDTPYNERLTLKNRTTLQEEQARRHHWGEFIELYNYSDKDLSLKNWYIKDHLSVVWLPDKIIKAGDFVVVAYSRANGYSTPFTELFSGTVGKENQIIYQDKILLRNKYEEVYLGYYAFDGKVPMVNSIVRTGTGREPGSNHVGKTWSDPDACYRFPSVQILSNDNYGNATPNPLDALYKPPTQSYESIMFNTYQQYYAYLDWSENVDKLNNNICAIVIPKIEQIPSGVFDQGKKCFNYDRLGNNTSVDDCLAIGDGPVIPKESAELTYEQLEEIKDLIRVYPNPATGANQYVVTISWSGVAIDKIIDLKVFNASGSSVHNFSPSNGLNQTSFSVATQLPGILVANFTLNTGQVISKNILKW